jgi:hypothetical protein
LSFSLATHLSKLIEGREKLAMEMEKLSHILNTSIAKKLDGSL